MAAVIGDLTQASNLVDTEWDAAPDADSTVRRANLFMAMPARAKACVGTDATRLYSVGTCKGSKAASHESEESFKCMRRELSTSPT